ncbi:MAG: hypothetical protein CVV64_02495 [Candidatus Wallbacteria bacterium HGW-Wallbacteria-1]|jgi:HEAT repeat protein|uniref:HEAT repeat domain-containing protein n=1 Tax=Candidatus Wallbacteria bacterium HGW-Wallbacteria-1 TaxID=2013854 RepID=A0A2N1PVD9_9BACT|nr:MAG: hypothetical protein CVV64_02495 [Candidatus Wallbacteria bacterium HGW-Wallbacteria-1]
MNLRERLFKALAMEGRIEALGIVSEALARGEDMAEHWMALEVQQRISLVSLIDRCGTAAARDCLRLLYSREDDSRVAATIVKALGNYRDMSLVPLFLDALNSEEPRIRANAIEALDCHDDAEIRVGIRPLLYDMDNRVRANAVKTLWDKDDPEVRDQALGMLRDEDLWVRTSAAYIIRHIPDSLFVDDLVRLLDDPFDSVREKAVAALGIIGDSRALMPLFNLLDRMPPPYIQSEILQALSAIGGTEVARKIEGYLRDQREGLLIRQAIGALGRCGDAETLSLLLELASHGNADEWICWEALNAIENLGFSSVAGDVIDIAANPLETVSVREKASRVLRRIAGPEHIPYILERLTDENMRLFEGVLDLLEGETR